MVGVAQLGLQLLTQGPQLFIHHASSSERLCGLQTLVQLPLLSCQEGGIPSQKDTVSRHIIPQGPGRSAVLFEIKVGLGKHHVVIHGLGSCMQPFRLLGGSAGEGVCLVAIRVVIIVVVVVVMADGARVLRVRILGGVECRSVSLLLSLVLVLM